MITTGSSEPSDGVAKYRIVSPPTINNRINEYYELEQERFINELKDVPYVGITSDVWSTKHTSYMGVTIHYINETTLKLVSKVLCCRHFPSPHTNTRIANILHSITEAFGITKKVIGCVTDNASNFVCAFKDFGISIDEFNRLKLEENDIDDDDQHDFVQFSEIGDDILPTHFRCASHTLCRVGTKDASNALKNDMYKLRSEQAFAKLNSLCKKYNRPKSSELIRIMLKSALVMPCKTRWNSLYDSVKRLIEFDVELLNQVMNVLKLEEFTRVDIVFLREYVKVMEPIATGIDLLQSDSYYSFLLPTLTNIKYSLDLLRTEHDLKYCVPLLNEISKGFQQRFGHFFDFNDDRSKAAIITAAVHPYFKTRWIHKDYNTDENISEIQQLLIREALIVAKESAVSAHSQREQHQNKQQEQEQQQKQQHAADRSKCCLRNKLHVFICIHLTFANATEYVFFIIPNLLSFQPKQINSDFISFSRHSKFNTPLRTPFASK